MRSGRSLLLFQTSTLPVDGNNQFPGDVADLRDGSWEATSTINLNDTAVLTALGATEIDGLREILITAEDVAGNVSAEDTLAVFIDTQGPQVTDVFITASPAFNLFGLKPTPAPTPLVNSITIDVRDLPARDAAFLYNALAEGSATGFEHCTASGLGWKRLKLVIT